MFAAAVVEGACDPLIHLRALSLLPSPTPSALTSQLGLLLPLLGVSSRTRKIGGSFEDQSTVIGLSLVLRL